MHATKQSALLSALLVAATCASAQQAAKLDIDAQKPIAQVSPTLYGLMTEEINHSYDGGLYPELIRNRAFMDNSDGPHWMGARRTGQRTGRHGDRQEHRPQPGHPAQPEAHASRKPTRRTRPASPTPATGAWRCAATKPISAPSMPKPMPASPARSQRAWSATAPAPSLAQASVPALSGNWQAVRAHAEDRRRPGR